MTAADTACNAPKDHHALHPERVALLQRSAQVSVTITALALQRT